MIEYKGNIRVNDQSIDLWRDREGIYSLENVLEEVEYSPIIPLSTLDMVVSYLKGYYKDQPLTIHIA